MPTTLADFAAPAIERPLPLRRRADIVVRPQWFRQRRYWVLKDPLTLRFFYFTDEEHFLWQALDGHASLAELTQQFEARFAPVRLKLDRLQHFLRELHRNGLVLAERAGQGEQLQTLGKRRQREEMWRSLGNLLAIRWRGIDPSGILNWLTPAVGGVFSRGFLIVWSGVVSAALVVSLLNLDELLRRLPDFAAFFSGENLVWLLVTLVVVKTLHEFGHAVALRRFGGECHELGIQLLLLTPCLYCNVSDAWLLPSKWRRIAVSAAGMFVELFLAAVAMIVWRYSEPGLLNSLCLNTVFVCSVGTLLFNGNPLLRYDGYYILSDLVEIPNLESRSQAALKQTLASWCLGVDQPAAGLDERQSGWLAAFAAVASIYRSVLLVTVYLYLRRILVPLGLSAAADAYFLVALAGMVIAPATGLWRFLREASVQGKIHRGRVLLTAACLALAVAGILLVPLPYRVVAPLVLQPQGAKHVYVTVAGNLQNAIAPGREVKPGEQLAVLTNRQVQRERIKLENERNQQRLHVAQLEAQRGTATDAGDRLPAARQALDDLEQRLVQVVQHEERLTIESPVAGTVLPPPARQRNPGPAGKLASWRGTPLDAENVGGHLPAGTLLCLIGDPTRLEAVAILGQSEVEFVRSGQTVRLALDQWPQEILSGRVREIAKIDLETQPSQLVAVGRLASTSDPHGRPQPLETSYQVLIELDAHSASLLPGAPGRCKILTDAQRLGQRLARYLSRTFRFDSPR